MTQIRVPAILEAVGKSKNVIFEGILVNPTIVIKINPRKIIVIHHDQGNMPTNEA